MKKIITVFVFCFLIGKCFSQAGEWVWIKGDNIVNQPGNYGVQGVPSPTNNPPSLYEPCEWTDLNGNFWLFGGSRSGSTYNDLWKYNPLTNEWTWMKGPGIVDDPGNHGVQGISDPANNPPCRGFGVVSWVDDNGNFWLLGGCTYTPFIALYSDLWKYNISTNEWTWMKGSNILNAAAVYGTQGMPAPSNVPGNRNECAASWTDNAGDLWFFGGQVEPTGSVNDMWRYNIASNQWTWMKGSQFTNQPTVYGTLGIEAVGNTPGARSSYCDWKDNSGNLWMMGGIDFVHDSIFNDLWRYNVNTNNWTWMGGNSSVSAPGNYGTKCFADSTNIPDARGENRAAWKDTHGNFWFFGGWLEPGPKKNDLWMYCHSSHQWIWQGGDSTLNPTGHWGTIGISSPLNKPNGRSGSVGWTDNNNHLFLFGGLHSSWYNDLWKFTIDSTCGICPAPNSIEANNPLKADELVVFPNPTNSSLTISFQSSTKQNIKLRIYNTLGKQIYFSKEETTKGKFEKEINVEKWSEGIYFLQVKMKEGNMSMKVVINH